MFKKFEINGVHTIVDKQTRAYVAKKIGRLDRYVSRHGRESAHAEVFLKETKAKNQNRFVCEVSLHLPHQTIVVQEAAINMFAAIDIVEAKLKTQLQKYKDTHSNGKFHRHVMARFRRRNQDAAAEV